LWMEGFIGLYLGLSEKGAKSPVENGIWLCGNCTADMLVDRGYALK